MCKVMEDYFGKCEWFHMAGVMKAIMKESGRR